MNYCILRRLAEMERILTSRIARNAMGGDRVFDEDGKPMQGRGDVLTVFQALERQIRLAKGDIENEQTAATVQAG